MKTPSERDIKRLCALSLNRCAFPGCKVAFADKTGPFLGEICHIKARSPDGPRYDPKQTEEERHAFSNLILLCGNHHIEVDGRPERFTVELLQEMKEMHERIGNIEISSEDVRVAKLLLNSYIEKLSPVETVINQMAKGNKNIQVVGNYYHYEKPPTEKRVIQLQPGAISPAERRIVHSWIESLAENTVNMSRQRAFGMWWTRFKSRFRIEKYEEFLSSQMGEAGAWYRQQMAMLVRGLKTKAPDAWRQARYGAIKQAMRRMGVEDQAYYADLAARLRMKKDFVSLTHLTKKDLERVYTMVLRDAREL